MGCVGILALGAGLWRLGCGTPCASGGAAATAWGGPMGNAGAERIVGSPAPAFGSGVKGPIAELGLGKAKGLAPPGLETPGGPGSSRADNAEAGAGRDWRSAAEGMEEKLGGCMI